MGILTDAPLAVACMSTSASLREIVLLDLEAMGPPGADVDPFFLLDSLNPLGAAGRPSHSGAFPLDLVLLKLLEESEAEAKVVLLEAEADAALPPCKGKVTFIGEPWDCGDCGNFTAW